jgi:hypothetical protein
MPYRKYLFILAAIILAYNSIYSQSEKDALESIKKESLIKIDSLLASRDLNGRLPGSMGYNLAASYMAKEMKAIKLKPITDESYFQNLTVEYNEVLPGETFSIIKNGIRTQFVLGKDYVYRGFTGSGHFTAPVVFCGYGLSQPELGYDDYAGIDVKGKVVMVYKYNPKWNLDGKNFTNGNPREKSLVALKHGAVGILFISFPNDKEPQKLIGSVLHGDGEQPINFPQIHISLSLASSLYEGSGKLLSQVQSKIDSTKQPYSFSLNDSVQINVTAKYVKNAATENICGILEGSDPKLKDEYIILGAHLDHVGEQAGKIYFPGANDNASGSSAVLQIAQAFTKLSAKPKRSICFVLFASEEQGLNGSRYFAGHLPFPKEKVKAMFNFDCIGHGDSIQVYGGESSPDLWNSVKNIDEQNNRLLVSRTGKGGGADASPFFEIGIPTLYFVSTNSYTYLHMIDDKPETLNPDLFQAITRLGFITAIKEANK